ncbi:hypothetical protein NDN08_005323 [Rhodosorus marinus]|uniref:Uncharacterized protein n=1 Tax=Rhodosorus marinus TaxID=101924 RepID=A0AAV8V4A3_9RHOD|nr:hypothetical protein NDN08_005323 [Rhodosorus marinus]
MKYGLVLILLAGIFGLTVCEVSTCATSYNPLVSSYTSVSTCYELEVDGGRVGIVTTSTVVKTQGPNEHETCVRFTFVVREGVRIRRAKVGLWLESSNVPLDNTRFTRKRKFLDSEPTTVRIDACLDDVRAVGDCCSGGGSAPFVVVEAKVRMEDGKVRTAALVDNRIVPLRQQISGPPLATSDIACAERLLPSSPCIAFSAGSSSIRFEACPVQLSCDFVGGKPEFAGVNRIDLDAGIVQVVISPVAENLASEALELTVYEPSPVPSPGTSIPAYANTVARRPAVAVEAYESFSIAIFLVPELSDLDVVAFALELVFTGPIDMRYSVRAFPQQRELLEFISFSSSQVIANSGPVEPGQLAADSYFGALPAAGVVGRIGSVICGYCEPLRGEWEVLQPVQPQGLNDGQFVAALARQLGRCIYDAQIGILESVCGPAGEEGILTKRGVFKGQVVCECTDPLAL